MYLEALKHHNEQKIIAQYIRFEEASCNPTNCPAHRELMSRMCAMMESNKDEIGQVIAHYIKGYIYDKNLETFEERKELNKL